MDASLVVVSTVSLKNSTLYDSLHVNAQKQHMYMEMLKGKGCTVPPEILIAIYIAIFIMIQPTANQ